MQLKLRFMGVVAALLVLLAAVPAISLASGPPVAFSANVVGLAAGGGTTTVTQAGNQIVVHTVGEVTSATLDCAGDPGCLGTGLNGATLTTSHSSLVRLTPTAVPGAFSVTGHLQGTLDIGGLIQGPFGASISGIASCVPVGPNPCGTFFISVTDSGNWNAPGAQARGTLNLLVAGVVGLGFGGSGTLTGTIHP